MPQISGKRAFLELLKQEGVEVMFGNPGTTELPLMDALAADQSIRYVLGLQEAVVMGMADGYAQASGKVPVVNLHVAPGLGNAMGMLYDAQKANSPVLVTAGQQDQSFSATEPFLWGDLPTLARPLVKSADEVRRIEDLPRLVHRAVKTALAPPTGPVFLSLPADVLNAEADLKLGQPTRVSPAIRADSQAIEAAAQILARAERPIILVGDIAAQTHAHAEVVRLAEILGAPVHPEGVASRAVFPASHPLYQGPTGRLQKLIREALAGHDVLLSIGADIFTMSLPSDIDPMPDGLAVIHIDTDPWQLGKNYPADVAILGDPRASLPELADKVEAAMTGSARQAALERGETARQQARSAREKLRARAKSEAGQEPIRALALMEAIGSALPPEAVVIEETLSSGPGLHLFLKTDDPQALYGLRGGGIGWGLPAAIGVKLALPDRPVVALVGDGSAMYSCQALWTAAHDKVAVIFVIINNGSYRILKQRTNALRGHAAQTGIYVGMDLTDPPIDYVGLAKSLGVEARRITRLTDVTEALESALKSTRPLLLDVIVDGSFTPV